MSYHIVCRIGPDDTFSPKISKSEAVHLVSLERPSDPRNVRIRNSVSDVLQKAGLLPPPDAADLLNLAMTVYAADLGIPRGLAFDRWTRDLVVHIPVIHPEKWQAEADALALTLGFLSGDHWQVHFRKRKAATAKAVTQQLLPPEAPSAVSLFSGGLDSFIGAVERLEHQESLALVGHHGAGMVNSAQEHVYDALKESYPGKSRLLPFYVQVPAGLPGRDKKTTRARSFLFLGLGTAVAAASGKKVPLLVPENGLISINAPLLDPRMGSLSTRTTHPHFLNQYRDLLDGIDIDVSIEAPYRFHTKGEMVKGVVDNNAFRRGVFQTQSCSHPEVGRYRRRKPGTHCGYCVPCIIRRASLAAAGLDDPKHYLSNVRRKVSGGATAEGRDLLAFKTAIERLNGASRRHLCAEVLGSGPIPPDEVSEYVDVYKRGMAEVARFLTPVRVKV